MLAVLLNRSVAAIYGSAKCFNIVSDCICGGDGEDDGRLREVRPQTQKFTLRRTHSSYRTPLTQTAKQAQARTKRQHRMTLTHGRVLEKTTSRCHSLFKWK